VERAKEMLKVLPEWRVGSHPVTDESGRETGEYVDEAKTFDQVMNERCEARDIFADVVAALEKAEQQLGALRDYANHLMACAARNGRSCDCGLERLFIALAPSEQREG
jgi:hypothetical protein